MHAARVQDARRSEPIVVECRAFKRTVTRDDGSFASRTHYLAILEDPRIEVGDVVEAQACGQPGSRAGEERCPEEATCEGELPPDYFYGGPDTCSAVYRVPTTNGAAWYACASGVESIAADGEVIHRAVPALPRVVRFWLSS